jgi:diguanylate cyclase (GGDEF)-like protein
MLIERISLRTLTIGIVGLLAVLSVVALAMTAQFFRSAAFEAQRQNLSRVVAVASDEVLRQLDTRLFALGTEFQARPAFRSGLVRLQEGSGHTLQEELQDPFVHGFSLLGNTDLVKLRVFDANLNLLMQNDSPVEMPATLAPALLRQAAGRQGADRLKAVGGLWLSSRGARYSVLLPIGGLKLMGYLEVVADPAFNLRTVADMTRMPLSIYAADGGLLHTSTKVGESNAAYLLPVEHVLHGNTGELAFRLISLSDVTQLSDDLKRTTLIAVAAVVGLIGLATLIVLGIFNRFLLQPVRAMQVDMERCAEGDLSVSVGRRMLREFCSLADSFNLMAQQLAAKIKELQQLSCIDSLTGLSNRRHFDLSLEMEWQRALRSHEPLSLLMVDVDHFKLYNDHYGHVGGDVCLRTVADTLGKIVQRSTDLPARYGGEEFGVLLPGTPLSDAISLAERLLAALQVLDLPHAASALGRVSVSIGVASCCATEAWTPADLVRSADGALYEAKRAGRNRQATA